MSDTQPCWPALQYPMDYLGVVLHRPQHPGNLGAVARAMANFGVRELRLVAPECDIDGVARARAKRGRELLAEAKLYDTIEEAIADGGWVVATSGIGGHSAEGYHRHPISPVELADELTQRNAGEGLRGPLLLLFGPEDHGLSQDELALAELLVTVPTNSSCQVLNLSHAVAIILAQLWMVGPAQSGPEAGWRAKPAPPMTKAQREKLVARLHKLAGRVAYRPYKLPRIEVMLRRFIGRANPSLWDYHSLMGLAKRIGYNLDRLDKLETNGGDRDQNTLNR